VIVLRENVVLPGAVLYLPFVPSGCTWDVYPLGIVAISAGALGSLLVCVGRLVPWVASVISLFFGCMTAAPAFTYDYWEIGYYMRGMVPALVLSSLLLGALAWLARRRTWRRRCWFALAAGAFGAACGLFVYG